MHAQQPTIVISHPNDISIPWAQHVVAHHCSQTKVTGLKVNSSETGTTTRVRLTVELEGPTALPKQWFVKIPSLAWRARLITALPRLLHVETRFYREIAGTIPLARPALLAAQSRVGQGATLVLADVAERGARPGLTGEALTFAQASAVVNRLARFHAAFWNIDSRTELHWMGGPIRRLEDALGTLLAVPLMRLGLRKAGDAIPAALHAAALNYARRRRRAMRYLNSGDLTLIHRDCHPGNFFWLGAEPGLLDWQLVRSGEGIADVAYFLATALEPELRRNHERPLIEQYRQTLQRLNVACPSEDVFWQRYRAHLSYPFEAMVVTLAVGGMMDKAANLEMIRRSALALQDTEGFAALEAAY